MDARGKKRGSLLISVPTQTQQHGIVQKGIVIGAIHHEARLFDHAQQVRQCFNCGAWGHTQASCGKPVRCGRCAGGHQTRDCASDTVCCSNCGQTHRAWQKSVCPVFRAYLNNTSNRRILATREIMALRQGKALASPEPSMTKDGFQMVSHKRLRAVSPGAIDGVKRRVGRPTHLTVAARDPSQRTLYGGRPSNPPTASQRDAASSQKATVTDGEDNSDEIMADTLGGDVIPATPTP